MPIYDLNQKIFTFNKRLTGEDLTKIQGGDKEMANNLDMVIKGLKCMRGIEEDYFQTFKFFQFKRSKIKSGDNQEVKEMICFSDIS
jgi:signal transduction histidine kinase